ncbi:MAG: aconitate hydratase, partial [Desulfobacterales bacterium]|nr:aconitate hydratase [Desulfobacterales bacterium]
IDERFYHRALQHQKKGFVVVGGNNYGQGSSREHAALAPRYLGLKIVIVKSFARIHWQNLINFGILPLTFVDPADYNKIDQEDELETVDIRRVLRQVKRIRITNKTKNETYETEHTFSERQIEMVLEGSLINVVRKKQ